MTDRDHAPDPELAHIGLSHVGHVELNERETGYRWALAHVWRVLQHLTTAQQCRDAVVLMGTRPVPDLSGPPRARQSE